MSEMVKITIRLPKPLVKLAKLHAWNLEEDLQDLVARELWGALRTKPVPVGHKLRMEVLRQIRADLDTKKKEDK
jgi:hypothetical protein